MNEISGNVRTLFSSFCFCRNCRSIVSSFVVIDNGGDPGLKLSRKWSPILLLQIYEIRSSANGIIHYTTSINNHKTDKIN